MKIETIGIIIHPEKKKGYLLLNKIAAYLKKRNIRMLSDIKLKREKVVSAADLIIVLGGDGTLLNAARDVKDNNKIILGVNLGRLGFLTEVSGDDIIKTINHVLSGKYKSSERMRLEAVIKRGSKFIKTYNALNEVVIGKNALSRILSLNLIINNETITTYACDGLIVSTATGSTAHALASGGPIVQPTIKAIILCPICPHTLTNRPLIVEEDTEICVVVDPDVESRDLTMTMDGQVGLKLLPKDKIYIKRSKYNIKLVSSISKSYFRILKEKFDWGG
ncbi:MAG: NAD(+)/NADH kinase [Candidatus Omnitrophota bacterium]